jgi:hypothetical protein
MVITERFVYIHLPKTGGTFVEAALQRLFGDSAALLVDTATERGRALIAGARDQHQTVSEIPTQYRDRPIAFTVRNPFDHHVSLFEFGWWRTHPRDTFDEAAVRATYPHYPAISFEEYLRAFYDLRLLDRDFVSPALAERLTAQAVGPLTYQYLRFLFQRPQAVLDDLPSLQSSGSLQGLLSGIHFLRQESLRRSLYRFLLAMGHPPSDVRFVLTMDRVYPDDGPRRPSPEWRSYYTPELLRLVRSREWLLFSLFSSYAAG